MATLETQVLDDIIVKSRRKLLTMGGTALAGILLAGTETAHAATAYNDSDILNFALNLEYLEANFYYLAAFGCTIDKAGTNALAMAAGAVAIPITGTVGTPGGSATSTGAAKTPFTNIPVSAYCNETAIEEGKHVLFLQSAIGSATYVAQPTIALDVATWTAVANAAGITGTFNPYASDANFLIGAYVFEDVGVTAYHGAASLLTSSGNLSAAAGILAVEAYHAGLVRTTINALDPVNANGYLTLTDQVSNLRANAAKAAASTNTGNATYDASPDDYGLLTPTGTVRTATLASSTSPVSITQLVDADLTYEFAFARSVSQVLNIVTLGKAINGTTPISPAQGGFFPAGMNAGPNGFK